MTGESEINVGYFPHFLKPMLGIVGKQYFEVSVFKVILSMLWIRFLQVTVFTKRRFSPVFDANQSNRVFLHGVSLHDEGVLIVEHLPSGIVLLLF